MCAEAALRALAEENIAEAVEALQVTISDDTIKIICNTCRPIQFVKSFFSLNAEKPFLVMIPNNCVSYRSVFVNNENCACTGTSIGSTAENS